MADKPSVLFVCVHNAGRSQMAAGYLNHLADSRVEVRSAGSEPADKINPVAVQAMAEEGIDITAEQPKILTTEAVKGSDVVITMGCGDTCPYYPGKRYEDWSSTTLPAKASRQSDRFVMRSGGGLSSSSVSCNRQRLPRRHPEWTMSMHFRVVMAVERC